MSLEELRSDLQANAATINAIDPALSSSADLVNLIKFTLWPFIENVVNEVSEMDEAMQDMVDNAEDILQEETAGVFASVFIGAAGLIAELEKRLKMPEDAKIVKTIKQWKKTLAEANNILAEITIAHEEDPPEEGGDGEDDEEGHEDEGDDDDDDDEQEAK